MRHGILLIDKPEGMTSHDVVAIVRQKLHEPKIGHGGTLDPLATGLLVLFVGAKALKVIELFAETEKTYEARIVFGTVSATYDREGPLTEMPERAGWTPPTDITLRDILTSHFLGTIAQTPPAHSALHIEGKRAYEIVRENPEAELALPPRPVTIHAVRLVSYRYPRACIRVRCGSGTYIRSLAHDLGQILRCGAYLENLKRLRVGAWRLEDACTMDDIVWSRVAPLKDILLSLPRRDLTEQEWQAARNGRTITATLDTAPVIAWFDGLPVAILERDEAPGQAHPRKVL